MPPPLPVLDPDACPDLDTDSAGLRATLRPYQRQGVRWLYDMARQGRGACLGDDMGLGKTISLLAVVLARRHAGLTAGLPSLLILPASLIGNWQREAERFAPGLNVCVAHASAGRAALDRDCDLSGVDLVLTTYGNLGEGGTWLLLRRWDLAVLDEGQNVKNGRIAVAAFARMVNAQARIVLTGTPLENCLGDIKAIFGDFLRVPGLCNVTNPAVMAERIRPYMLRRLKSQVEALPEKRETRVPCALTDSQRAAYSAAVAELAAELHGTTGAPRRTGCVLAALTKLKQITTCALLGTGAETWTEADSGKLAALRTIAEGVKARDARMIVFSQYRTACGPLAGFLAGIFGRPGLVLTGETPIRERTRMVAAFQAGESPFMVLSLKAGGSGLTLTAADTVVLADAWWNPAVMAQAMDRTYRIGQKSEVAVYALACPGTVEDRIADLLTSKSELARGVTRDPVVGRLAAMGDRDLLDFLKLEG